MRRPAIPEPTARRDRGLPRPSKGAARPATPRAAGARPAPRRCCPAPPPPPARDARPPRRRRTAAARRPRSGAGTARRGPLGRRRAAEREGPAPAAAVPCMASAATMSLEEESSVPHRAAPCCIHAAAAGAERHRRLRGHAARRAGRALRLRSGLRRLAGEGAARGGGGGPGARAPAHRRRARPAPARQQPRPWLRVPGDAPRAGRHDPARPWPPASSPDNGRHASRHLAPACATCRRPLPATRARSPARRGGAVPTTSSSTWRARSWRARAPWSFIPASRGTGCAPCTARPRRRMWRSSRTCCPRSPCPRATRRGRGSAFRRMRSSSARPGSPPPRSASTG